MRPYYEDEHTTLYHGDCREVLPSIDAFDVVLTDPPYGIEGGSGRGAERGKGSYLGDFDDTPAYISAVVIPVIRSCIARCACVVLTPGIRNLMLYPQPQSFGCFYQPAAVGLQTFGNVDAQPILYYGKNASKRVMGNPCSYKLTESAEGWAHPCEKPRRAWSVLLANVSLPTSIVLDPFAGSGTTLVAAKNLGRRAIGIEISEEYCAVAVERLSQNVLDLGGVA